MHDLKKEENVALLVGIDTDGDINTSMDELEELAHTAGIKVAGRLVQKRDKPSAATYLGKGKLEELDDMMWQNEPTMLIFNDELTPAQFRNLTDKFDCAVIDRTLLILDIFAMGASSAEGKLQVELAQLRYRLTRLTGMGKMLSRLGGGIGTRGPGETKLEVDRRRVKERISQLQRGIENIFKSRKTRRSLRQKRALPLISIVGYTNAGKSTLLNALTNASALTEDKLFATLEPLSRRLRFPKEREVIVSDTVGFIRDLPKGLLTAFGATLEELHSADLLLHVVDAGEEAAETRLSAVEGILENLGLLQKPRLLVWNKADKAPAKAEQLRLRYGGVALSAHTGEGLEALLFEAARYLFVHKP